MLRDTLTEDEPEDLIEPLKGKHIATARCFFVA